MELQINSTQDAEVHTATDIAPSDDELRKRIKAGSHTAFSALFLRYRVSLCHFLQRSWPSMDAERIDDLVQETFCQLWERRTQLHDSGSFRPLLRVIASQRAVDEFRYQGIRNCPSFTEELDSSEPSPEDKLNREELALHIRDLLADLDESQRMALQFKLAGMPLEEVAFQLGCSTQAAKLRIQSAFRHLQKRLNVNLGNIVGGFK